MTAQEYLNYKKQMTSINDLLDKLKECNTKGVADKHILEIQEKLNELVHKINLSDVK